MANATEPKLIVVLGPTATGKSDLAVEIALALSKSKQVAQSKNAMRDNMTSVGGIAEIISADSRQIYKGLDVGAGKITKKEMLGVPHHGLDLVSPRRKNLFTVSEFQEYAYAKIEEIIARGNIPILCGGTGFYIQSIVDGMIFPDVEADPDLRKKLGGYSKERLQNMLMKLDPKRYQEIDRNNPVRLVRAIEIAKAIGKTPPIRKDERFETLQIGLDMSDEMLKEKVTARVLKRLGGGASGNAKNDMVREAKQLHAEGLSWKRMRQLGLEYGLLADLLQKKLAREQFIERLTFDIWHFVKRQRAWFKRDPRILWIDPTKKSARAKALKIAKDFMKKK